MEEISDIFKDFDFKYWLIENFLWELVFVPVVFFIWYFMSAFFLDMFLLKNNRLGLGTGARLYLADRFVQLWYSNNEISYEVGKKYSPQPGFLYAYMHTSVIDDKLIEKKLIRLDRNPKSTKDIVVSVKNIKNRLVLFFIEFYLIHFIFDGREHYENLKENHELH